jgi:hypothetical protein
MDNYSNTNAKTQQYVARRTGEGMSLKEFQRCLKRYITRGLFPIILNDLAMTSLLDIGASMRSLKAFFIPCKQTTGPSLQFQNEGGSQAQNIRIYLGILQPNTTSFCQ